MKKIIVLFSLFTATLFSAEIEKKFLELAAMWGHHIDDDFEYSGVRLGAYYQPIRHVALGASADLLAHKSIFVHHGYEKTWVGRAIIKPTVRLVFQSFQLYAGAGIKTKIFRAIGKNFRQDKNVLSCGLYKSFDGLLSSVNFMGVDYSKSYDRFFNDNQITLMYGFIF